MFDDITPAYEDIKHAKQGLLHIGFKEEEIDAKQEPTTDYCR